jgi:hypothetical protein
MTWGRKTDGRTEAQAEVPAAVSANEGLQPLDYMLQVRRELPAIESFKSQPRAALRFAK